jgi:4-amino-4-deoxy-L-arabinose transferase-like glycosyltransferase
MVRAMTAMPAATSRSAGSETRQPAFRFLLLALLLAWGVALFARSYWTPDEPREAALAASMLGGPLALPQLAGVTFAEKPPLSYWLSAASMRLFGNRPAAARLPLLLYALLGVLAIGRLGRAAGSRATGHAAAAIFATALLAFQVQVWLECDALLVCGVCVALCGGYLGLAARSPRQRCLWYLVLHAGLTLAFFAKNFAGWLVPVTALALFIVWQRRWRELLRWELWAGALVPLLAIAAWVYAIAHGPQGAAALRILFWDNLVGRAVPVAAPAPYAYALAHRNAPGKYLLELLIDLLPWSALLLCALGRVGRSLAHRVALPGAWRFALCASFPALLVLSLAATARSIYAAPCIPALALLCALWITADGATRAARLALIVSRVLIALVAAALTLLSLELLRLRAPVPLGLCALSALVAFGILLALLLHWDQRDREPVAALTLQATAFALLLALGTLAPLRVFDRSQDLLHVARAVSLASAGAPLLLWRPDETTLAWAQLYLPPAQWRALRNDQPDADSQLAQAVRADTAVEVLVQVPAPSWKIQDWRAYLRDGSMPTPPPSAIAIAPALQAAGLTARAVIERPGGRRYLLLRRAAG